MEVVFNCWYLKYMQVLYFDLSQGYFNVFNVIFDATILTITLKITYIYIYIYTLYISEALHAINLVTREII